MCQERRLLDGEERGGVIGCPGNPKYNIGLYLQPLIQELNMWWKEGICTLDVSRKETSRWRRNSKGDKVSR